MSVHKKRVTENADGSVVIEETEITNSSRSRNADESISENDISFAGIHQAASSTMIEGSCPGAANATYDVSSSNPWYVSSIERSGPSRSNFKKRGMRSSPVSSTQIPGGSTFQSSRSGTCGTPTSSYASPRTPSRTRVGQNGSPVSTNATPRTAGESFFDATGASRSGTCGRPVSSNASPRTAGESFFDPSGASRSRTCGSSNASPRTAGDSFFGTSRASSRASSRPAGVSCQNNFIDGLSGLLGPGAHSVPEEIILGSSLHRPTRQNRTFPQNANASRGMQPVQHPNSDYTYDMSFGSDMETMPYSDIMGPANFFSSTRVGCGYGDYDYVELDASSIYPDYGPPPQTTLPRSQRPRPYLQSASMPAGGGTRHRDRSIVENRRVLHHPDYPFGLTMPSEPGVCGGSPHSSGASPKTAGSSFFNTTVSSRSGSRSTPISYNSSNGPSRSGTCGTPISFNSSDGPSRSGTCGTSLSLNSSDGASHSGTYTTSTNYYSPGTSRSGSNRYNSSALTANESSFGGAGSPNFDTTVLSRSGVCGGSPYSSNASPRTAGSSFFNTSVSSRSARDGTLIRSNASPRTAGESSFNTTGGSRSGTCGSRFSSNASPRTAGESFFNTTGASSRSGTSGSRFGSNASPRTAGESFFNTTGGSRSGTCGSRVSSNASPRTAGESFFNSTGASPRSGTCGSPFSSNASPRTAGESFFDATGASHSGASGSPVSSNASPRTAGDSFFDTTGASSSRTCGSSVPQNANASRANSDYTYDRSFGSNMETLPYSDIMGPANFFSSTRDGCGYGDYDYVELDASSIYPDRGPPPQTTLPRSQRPRPYLLSNSMPAGGGTCHRGQSLVENRRVLHHPDYPFGLTIPSENNSNSLAASRTRSSCSDNAQRHMHGPRPGSPSLNSRSSHSPSKNVCSDKRNAKFPCPYRKQKSHHHMPEFSGYLDVSGKLKIIDSGSSFGNSSKTSLQNKDPSFKCKYFPKPDKLRAMEKIEKNQLDKKIQKLQSARRAEMS